MEDVSVGGFSPPIPPRPAAAGYAGENDITCPAMQNMAGLVLSS